MRFEDLTTMAKVNCMNEFLNKVIPYCAEDCNDGDLDELAENINIWLYGGQFTIDSDGNWYDEGRKM